MTQRFFINPDGVYLGSYDGPDETMPAVFEGGVRVEIPPEDGRQVWDFGTEAWLPREDLAAAKAALKADVDRAAEIERRKYITSGSGQAMTYMQKSDEAARYLLASDPVNADYPLLAAEVGITAPTIAEVAGIVDGAYRQWQIIGAAIEAARLAGKSAIDAAATIDAAQAAADAVTWP